jgi:hypothetical protein
VTNCRALNESETIVRTNFEQFADFPLTLLEARFKKWIDETVVCVFSTVLETSANPSLIVASCDSHVILQSLTRSTSDSLALAISVLSPILRRFPELPFSLIQLAASVLRVVKCRTFAPGTLLQDGLHGLLLVSAMRDVFVKNHR